MTDKPRVSSELSRDLTLFHITMMGLGMMIGAGVFVGIGNSIGLAGPGGVILTFSLNGLLAILTAMSYAELSSAIPKAGGAYNFARVGFGRGTSFLAGWMEWFASSVAGSLYAVTFATYTLRYIEHLCSSPWLQSRLPFVAGVARVLGQYPNVSLRIVAAIVAGLFLFINYRGVSETGKIGAFFTLGQTVFLAFIGIAGFVVAAKDPSRFVNFKPFLPYGWSRLLVTMGFTYVAFEGFEVIAQAGDETIDPKRNLPKAMLYSVFIATLTYVAVAFASVVAVKVGSPGVVGEPWRWIGSFKERGFGEAVSRLMPAANLLLTLAVIFASTSALNATIFSATRASYALGRDRMLPAFFSRISAKRKTPWVALAFSGAIIIVVAVALPTKDVASSASIMFLFLFFLVNICAIKIRRNMGDEMKYGYVMPFFPLPPIVALVCQGLLALWLVNMSWLAWVVAPLWILGGVVIYHVYSKSHLLTTAEEIFVLEEAKAPPGEEYRVMVPVANPDNALKLVRGAYKICGAKQARVELIHMVPVPDQVPLTDARKYMLEGQEGIVESMLYLSPRFPVSSTVRYCRSVARGIVSAVREKKIDTVIMGWRGRVRRQGVQFGLTLDSVIERTPCNVAIMKDCGFEKFRRILVPVRGGPNSAFALEIATIVAEKDGHVKALTVENEKRPFNINDFVAEQQKKLSFPPGLVVAESVKSSDVVSEIVEQAEDYDLIVLGCSYQPLVYKVVQHSVPELIAQRAKKPLIMVKAAAGIRSWVNRWI